MYRLHGPTGQFIIATDDEQLARLYVAYGRLVTREVFGTHEPVTFGLTAQF